MTTSRLLSAAVTLALVFGVSSVGAQPAPCNTAYYFGNGILTTFDRAVTNASALARKLNERAAEPESHIPCSVPVDLAYNDTHGPLADLFEAYVQQSSDSDPNSVFWQIIEGILPPSPLFIHLARAAAERNIAVDLGNQLDSYRATIQNGGDVVVVAHSQGNLFANAAHAALGAPERSHFKIVSVATPADNVAGQAPPFVYTTLIGDSIVAVPGALAANLTNDLSCIPYFVCHEFVNAYLGGWRTGRRVANLAFGLNDQPVPVLRIVAPNGSSIGPGETLVIDKALPGLVPQVFVSGSGTIDSDGFFGPTGFAWSISNAFVVDPNAVSFGVDVDSGRHDVVLTVTDDLGASARLTATVVVRDPFASLPVAVNDAYSVEQGGELRVTAPGVLANDTYPSGATVEFLAPLPTGFAGSGDGSFTLDLSTQATFTGQIILQYLIHSTNGDSSAASATIQVTARTTPAVRLGWAVTPSGDITAMQVPPWSQGVTNFGWQFMMSRRATSANEWGATTCFGGAGGGYPLNLFQSPTDFISYNGGMNVFGMTGQDSLTRGGIGTEGCLVPGTYYFELSDLSSRQPDGGFTVNYFYELTFDGSVVSPVGDGVGTLLPVIIAPDGIVSFTCPADYVNVGYESLSGQYPDSSTPVSTNTLGPIFSCNALGASTYTMEGGFLNNTRVTPDGDYWVRLSMYGTPFSVTTFSRDWIYWKARRQNGVWSVLP